MYLKENRRSYGHLLRGHRASPCHPARLRWTGRRIGAAAHPMSSAGRPRPPEQGRRRREVVACRDVVGRVRFSGRGGGGEAAEAGDVLALVIQGGGGVVEKIGLGFLGDQARMTTEPAKGFRWALAHVRSRAAKLRSRTTRVCDVLGFWQNKEHLRSF
jgi:hypothetical protein